MKIALFGATGSVGSALLVHMLKGSSLTVGDEIVLVGRGSRLPTFASKHLRAGNATSGTAHGASGMSPSTRLQQQ